MAGTLPVGPVVPAPFEIAPDPFAPPFCSITSVIFGYLSRCGARCPDPGTRKAPGSESPGLFVGLIDQARPTAAGLPEP
ncbi:hypothetical protein Van01_40220 [Micromonospora andamanensis]|uniref:Uncharacterized protein n=1 Tax=Micromonospora andamanensis TaxID=1287068 RepID=A0ABQ4HYR8_9ACTN|nr:hypothetical protein Van01_40220 [Micromonospora andamanensis]